MFKTMNIHFKIFVLSIFEWQFYTGFTVDVDVEIIVVYETNIARSEQSSHTSGGSHQRL